MTVLLTVPGAVLGIKNKKTKTAEQLARYSSNRSHCSNAALIHLQMALQGVST